MFLSNLKHNIFKFLFSPKVDVVGGDCDRDTHCVPPKICENGNSVLGSTSITLSLLCHYYYITNMYTVSNFLQYIISVLFG